MKTKLFLGVALLFSIAINAQFGCGSAVVITDGYTATGITTPGNGGPEDWNNNPTGTSVSSSYWDDDVYLFEYTSGATVEDITMTIQSNNSWNGIGIFDDCSGMDLLNVLDDDGSTSSGSRTVSATIQPNNTVYIAVGQWGSPNDLDFDVTNFSVTIISCALPGAVTNDLVTTSSADFSWTDSSTEDGGYNWEVVPAGSGQGVGVVASGTTAADAVMVSATGLTSATNYDFYIQSNCGGSTSSWSSAVSFSTTAACGDTVYDTGGATGNYSSNESYTITYFPDVAGNVVTLDFISVALETCCDDLAVYDGVDTSATVLNADLTAPATFTASNAAGAITIAFDSDGSVQAAGWEALYTCAAPAPAPNCAVNPMPVDGAVDVPVGTITLTWDAPASGPVPTSYDLFAGAMSDGSDFALVGNFTTNTADVVINGFSTTIYYSVIAKNSGTDAVGCDIWSLTTESAPLGALCDDPIVVGALPYNTTGDTNGFGDDYTGSPGASCGSTSSYLNGDDIVYSYTPTANGDFNIALSGLSANYAGVFVYDSCANIGTTCLNGDVNGFSSADLSVDMTGIAGTTYYIVISTWAAPQSVAFTMDIAPPAVDYTWDGTAWDTTPEGNITGNDNMIVQSGTMAVLTSDITAGNVTLEAGASLDINAGAVTVMNDLVNNGTVSGSEEVILMGSGASLSGTGSITNLTVGAAGSVTVSGDQSIMGTLDVDSGGVLDAAGAITLVSNAMGTARVNEVDAGAITGDVNVERYIPGTNRSFRFLGSSVTGPNVFDSWQEAGVNAAGFGIQVTGVVGTVGTNNAATGLDETLTGNPSMFSWNDAGQSWDAIMNTTTEVLNAGDFYRVFVRGDRMTDLSSNTSAATATTLRATGSLLTGPYSVSSSVASGEFFAVANPYQSKLDMGLVAPANVATDMYYWDASLGTNGGYTNINIATGTVTAGAATNVLDAGQAVFFSSTGSSSVNIEESDKVGGTTNAAVFSAPVVNQLLRVKLYQTSRYQNAQSESDGMYIHFDNTFNDAVTFNDAIKWDGLNTNISVQKATGEQLSVERRSLPTVNESVPLHLSNHLATDYTMTVELDALPGLDVFVKDNLTNTLTPVANNGSTAVNFLVDANNAASIDPNRFEIVFQTVTLGLNDQDVLSAVRLYPNPVTGDELQLDLGSIDVSNNASVAIYNTLGQQVRTYNYDSGVSNTLTVNKLDTLSNGVYILTLTNGDATITRRFIKK